ncbi:hypothetical protein EWM64_g199 [Hericium alpestre]|uniref:Vacuole protein n=1 Tax=Hericium alpestre TaxID=135208 RepID=A0A4Z0AAP3_9AGAM|nr:hypothetical protein EWM64_g199 [Hericium alpestre]
MCGGPSWKREIVPDHKFDFVDTREFTDNGFGMRMKYLWLYVIVLKSFLVYVSDIFTAVTMLTTSSWSNQIFNSCPKTEDNGCVFIPFNIGKWLFVGCIIFSFLLLAYEARKSKKIIASRDISYAFTNIMANLYYSLRSYDHFCFFNHISDSTKKKDDFAFFVFFTFKSWKRLLLADGPRQAINGLTLYAIYLAKKRDGAWYDIGKYFAGNTFVTTALTISTLFTTLVFIGSLLLLIVAGVCYVPLLCYIQGNLKEYCCHKVDKRITEIIKRRNKQRLAKAAALAKKEAAGDFSHLKNKKGALIHQPLPQPTLPNVSLDDEFDDVASIRSRSPTYYSGKGGDQFYASEQKAAYDYPAMPAYNQSYSQHPDPNSYNSSAVTLYDDPDDYGSTAHLALGGAPYAQQSDPALPRSHTPGYVADPYDAGIQRSQTPVYPAPDPYDAAHQHSHTPGYVADPYDVYSGAAGAQYGAQQHQRHSHGYHVEDGGLAYDAHQDYIGPSASAAQQPRPTYTQQSPYGQRTPSPQYPSDGQGGAGQFHAM